MAALDPRAQFTIKGCPKNGARTNTTINDRRGPFAGFLGEAADLQILNDLGGGEVGEGLRDLVGLSDNINASGIIPADMQSQSDDQGANQVLGAMGFDANQVSTGGGGNLDLRSANAGYNSAKQVYGQVKAGGFTLDNAKSVAGQFRGLKTLLGNVYTPEGGESAAKEHCFATPYAEALTYAMAPKQKFMFVVDFQFNPGFEALADKFKGGMAFVVKQAERPNINFDYEEVNMYNFKTKVLKKTEYQPVTIRFYDDGLNATANFHDLYLRSVSPIANLDPSEYALVEERGMDFSNPGKAGGRLGRKSSASAGELYNGQKTPIRVIHLYHIYKSGRYMNRYSFVNPKILSLELDDLDMSTSDIGEIGMQIDYDGLHIHTSITLDPSAYQRITSLTSIGESDQYALKYSFPETAGNSTNSGIQQSAPHAEEEEGGFLDSASDLLSSAAGSVSDAFSSVFNSDGSRQTISDEFDVETDDWDA